MWKQDNIIPTVIGIIYSGKFLFCTWLSLVTLGGASVFSGTEYFVTSLKLLFAIGSSGTLWYTLNCVATALQGLRPI